MSEGDDLLAELETIKAERNTALDGLMAGVEAENRPSFEENDQILDALREREEEIKRKLKELFGEGTEKQKPD